MKDAFKADRCSAPTAEATKVPVCIFHPSSSEPGKIISRSWQSHSVLQAQAASVASRAAQPLRRGTRRTCGTFATGSTEPLSLLCLLLSQNPAGIPSMLQLEPRWRAGWLAETKHTSVCVRVHAQTHTHTHQDKVEEERSCCCMFTQQKSPISVRREA